MGASEQAPQIAEGQPLPDRKRGVHPSRLPEDQRRGLPPLLFRQPVLAELGLAGQLLQPGVLLSAPGQQALEVPVGRQDGLIGLPLPLQAAQTLFPQETPPEAESRQQDQAKARRNRPPQERGNLFRLSIPGVGAVGRQRLGGGRSPHRPGRGGPGGCGGGFRCRDLGGGWGLRRRCPPSAAIAWGHLHRIPAIAVQIDLHPSVCRGIRYIHPPGGGHHRRKAADIPGRNAHG